MIKGSPGLPTISIETTNLRLAFRAALDAAMELGIGGVVLDARSELNPKELSETGLRQIRKMLDDRGLRVAAVAFRTRRGYATQEDLERRVAGTKSAMELAYRLGAKVVLNSIGPVPPEDDTEGRQILLNVLHDLGQFGNRTGAVLATETGTESGNELAKLLSQLPEGALGVDLNPAKLLLGGFSPAEEIAALGPRILHVHVNDARRGSAAGLSQPVAVGRGDADIPALLAALDEHNYSGFFTLDPTNGNNPKEGFADAIARFRKWL